MIKWAELIPTMCGWSVPLEGDSGDDLKPYLYDTEHEVRIEIIEMRYEYLRQIGAGERDIDDEWEGECHQVEWDGEILTIIETGEQVDWRDQL